MPHSVQRRHFVLAKEPAPGVYPALMELTLSGGGHRRESNNPPRRWKMAAQIRGAGQEGHGSFRGRREV